MITTTVDYYSLPGQMEWLVYLSLGQGVVGSRTGLWGQRLNLGVFRIQPGPSKKTLIIKDFTDDRNMSGRYRLLRPEIFVKV